MIPTISEIGTLKIGRKSELIIEPTEADGPIYFCGHVVRPGQRSMFKSIRVKESQSFIVRRWLFLKQEKAQ